MGGIDVGLIFTSLPHLLGGLLNTVLLVGLALVFGLALGVLACAGKLYGRGLVRVLCVAYITVLRGIPEMVVMFWIYYCGPLILAVRPSSMMCAVISLSLYTGAQLAEVFRGGIQALPAGQFAAAEALAIPRAWMWLGIIAPQVFRMMVPALLGVVSLTIKVSGVASAIGVAELVYAASDIAGQSYRYFELFTAIGLIYFAIIFALSCLARQYERRLARSISS